MDDTDVPLSLAASLLAMLVLPFWLGTMQVGGTTLAAFCMLSGCVLTLADDWAELSQGLIEADGVIGDAALRTLSIGVPATFAFFAAVHLG